MNAVTDLIFVEVRSKNPHWTLALDSALLPARDAVVVGALDCWAVHQAAGPIS